MSRLNIPDLPVLDQSGNKLHFCSDVLKRETAIVSFIFTSCQGTCPLVGTNFARIAQLLAESDRPVRLILITTDPETDSPARLKAWADRFGSPNTWTLVTGRREDINRLSIAFTGAPVATTRHHVPRAIIGNDAYGSWTHTYALDDPTSLLQMVDLVTEANLVAEAKPPPDQLEPSVVPMVPLNTSPAAIGQWSKVMDWGVVAVHMTLLHNGTVLIWPRYDAVGTPIPIGALGSRSPQVRIWNPTNQTFLSVPNPYTNLFCSGHTVLSDGRVLVIGGHSKTAGSNADRGVFDTNLATPTKSGTVQWSRAAAMLSERWYPTVLPIPSGAALAIGGSYSGKRPTNKPPNQPAEIWESGRRGWTGFNHLIGVATNQGIQVAAVQTASGRVDVFMVGLDNRMWHSPQQPDGSFPDFAQRPVGIPQNRALRIAAVRLPNGRVDVYMVGLDNQIWHSVEAADGSFPDFGASRVGSPTNLALDISAVRRDNGRVDVFMVGLDNRMWHSPQQPNGSFPDFAQEPIAPPSDAATSISALAGAAKVYITRADDQTIAHGEVTSDFSWRELSGIGRPKSDTGWYIYYPWTYIAPNGKAFIAGPTKKTFWLDLSGNGSIELGPQSAVFRDYGSAAMYEAGKILILGGGTIGVGGVPMAEASAESIDLNSTPATWQPLPPMANRRKHANATVLPDGTVLVTGGTRRGGDPSANDEQVPVLQAELWKPQTGAWSIMASASTPRLYHSTALLLPSAKVLVAGGGQGGGPDDAMLHPTGIVDRPNAEIFSPPYLFTANGSQAKQPTITSVPKVIHYDKQIKITSPDWATISNITLVSCGSVTHAYDQNQRLCRLTFVPKKSNLIATTPPNGNVCPPGYYMLFILDNNGVPSEAKIVRLTHHSPLLGLKRVLGFYIKVVASMARKIRSRLPQNG